MTSPVPYSKPKRRLLNRFSLKFKTAEGSFVYAPANGKLTTEEQRVIITTEKGFVHKLSGTKPVTHGAVKAGERIGTARASYVIYNRFSPSGKQLDAMPTVQRDNGLKPNEWMRKADKELSKWPAGKMGPGYERVAAWHTSESPTNREAIYGVANYVNQQGWPYTILWNPYTGQFVQMYPADVGARAFSNDGSYPTNRHGKIRIQICVIGRAADAPLQKSPMRGRRELMEWLDSWGIPRVDNVDHSRSRKSWEKSGHTTHRSAPGNNHIDPGPIDFNKLFAP